MDQIEERLAEEIRKYDHLYNPMACNSWKDISANVGRRSKNAAMLPRPPTLSHEVESHCQQSAPGQGAWRREWPSPSDFFLYVALGTKSLDTPDLDSTKRGSLP
ncbi:unnamed protein product [Pleuronectes platessa]|uniref:Uncharacterized protein n=1 Tax=Pleuronectes platessa TaxID=8262 RepID=A0A9N7UWN6_PLEPL|nr:unnamed protein product [Pleuronectes platessa]